MLVTRFSISIFGTVFGRRGGGWVKGPPLFESVPLSFCARAHQENRVAGVCGAAAVWSHSLLLFQYSFVGAASKSTRYSRDSQAMRMLAPRSNQPERLDRRSAIHISK